MSPPTISVCVTTYNQREFIETCLRSILDQEVEADVHVLVGDDASTDGTSDIILALAREYEGRITHLLRNPNMGPCGNMFDLVARADGDFVARVDGDDFWLPGKLARQLRHLSEHPDCNMVCTNAITVAEDGRRLGRFNDVGDVRIGLPYLLRRGNFINNSSLLFRGSERYAWIDAEEQIDYQLHLQLARSAWLGHIGEPFSAYRVNVSGNMVGAGGDRVRELYWKAIQSVPRELVSDDDYAHGIADFLRRVFYRALRTRDMDLLRAWSRRVFAASPYGVARTTGIVAMNILRAGWKVLIGKLRGGMHSNVLYRR